MISKRAMRKDHKLIKEVQEIQNKINNVCTKLTKELGFNIGWSDAIELASGMSPYHLYKMDK